MFFRLTPMVKNLLLINVGVFLIAIIGFGNLSLANSYLGLHYFTSDQFSPYQFFTYMFAHGGTTHLLFNMIGLIFLGPLLEQFWGSKRFLTFYLVTGIGAAVLYIGINSFSYYGMKERYESYILNPNPDDYDDFIHKYGNFRARNGRIYYKTKEPFIITYYENPQVGDYIDQSVRDVSLVYNLKVNTPMVGASGAIYGILMAIGLLFPNTQFLLFFMIPVRAKYIVLALGSLAIYNSFISEPGDNVAHLAHLGGMVFAFIMIQYWKRRRDKFY